MVNFKGRIFDPAYANELIEIAAGDLSSAESLRKTGEGRKENICFLAQQCVEKCIKAILCFSQKEILFTHDIDLLLTLLPQNLVPPHQSLLGELTEYSLIRRYEKGYAILTDAELNTAITAARDTLTWAQQIIRQKP